MAEFFPEQFDGPVPDNKSPLIKRAERKAEMQEFWHLVFLYGRLTEEDREEFGKLDRVAMGYRICRELCRLKGILAEEDPLCASLALKPSPWVTPIASQVPDFYGGIETEDRFTVLTGTPTPIYPPASEEDPTFEPFFAAAREAAEHLQIVYNNAFGSKFLLDPRHRALWPSPPQLLAYENRLLKEVVQEEMEGGQVEARELLNKKGFLSWEAESTIRAARHQLVRNILMSTEEAKAVLMVRLESLIKRARTPDGADIRAELAAIKLMAWLQGLHRVEPEDGFGEIISIVKDIEQKEKREKA